MRYLAQRSHILWYFGFDKTSKAKKRQAEILINPHISIKLSLMQRYGLTDSLHMRNVTII